MKRKKKRPRFKGESFLGEWALTINPEKSIYVVSCGELSRGYPNFDNWSEEHGLATTRRQLEVERDHFGTVLFETREHAIAAAMDLSAPDNHKPSGICDCAQCLYYEAEARAHEAHKQQPVIEI